VERPGREARRVQHPVREKAVRRLDVLTRPGHAGDVHVELRHQVDVVAASRERARLHRPRPAGVPDDQRQLGVLERHALQVLGHREAHVGADHVAARDDDRDPVRDCGLVEREDARIVVVERRVAPAREQRDPPASELLDRAADLVDAVGVVRVDAREPDEPARVRVDELRDVGVLDATPDRGRLLAHDHRHVHAELVQLPDEQLGRPRVERGAVDAAELVLRDRERVGRARTGPVEVGVEEAAVRRLDAEVDDHSVLRDGRGRTGGDRCRAWLARPRRARAAHPRAGRRLRSPSPRRRRGAPRHGSG